MVSMKAILFGAATVLGSACALQDPDWRSMSVETSEVSYDGKTLCVSNEGGSVLCSTQDYDGIPVWNNYRQGNVRGARVWGDMMWATSDGNVQYTRLFDTDFTWYVVPGQLRTVTFDGKQLCGVNFVNEIMCADDSLTTNPNWRRLPGGTFTSVDLTDGVLYATSTDGTLYYGFSDGDPNWKKVPCANLLKQVAYDGGLLCGIAVNNELMCSTSGFPTNPAWMSYADEFTFVEVQAGRVYAVSTSTMVFMRYLEKPPAVPSLDRGWRQIPSAPPLRQINFDGRTLVGAAADQSVFAASVDPSGYYQWYMIDGLRAQHVVVWGDRLFGVDSSTNLWTAPVGRVSQATQLNGYYKQISTDGKQLCAVDIMDTIHCADEMIDSQPNWRYIPGWFQHVVVLNGVLLGSRPNDNAVFVGRSEGDANWRQIYNVYMRTFEYDGIHLCGTGSNENESKPVCMPSNGLLEGTAVVTAFDGQVLMTASNAGSIFALTQDNALYYRDDLLQQGILAK